MKYYESCEENLLTLTWYETKARRCKKPHQTKLIFHFNWQIHNFVSICCWLSSVVLRLCTTRHLKYAAFVCKYLHLVDSHPVRNWIYLFCLPEILCFDIFSLERCESCVHMLYMYVVPRGEFNEIENSHEESGRIERRRKPSTNVTKTVLRLEMWKKFLLTLSSCFPSNIQ